jgi:predicted metal-binding protein
MALTIQKSFDFKISGNELKVEIFGEFIPKNKIKINKNFFEKMCKEGCDKYGKHYGCPPGSPSFEAYTGKAENFLVLMFCASQKVKSGANFEEIEKLVYPKIDKVLRDLEKISGTKHIAARSCKLCEPCQREKNLSCKHQDKIRNCTVSLGIDCRDIAENIFHKPLVWQKGETLQSYVSFICLLPMKSREGKERIVNEFNLIFQ